MSDGLFGTPTGKQWEVSIPADLAETISDYSYGEKSGGMQSHMRDTITRLSGNTLSYDDVYIGRTFRYAYNYGEGGWQNVCRTILDTVRWK